MRRKLHVPSSAAGWPRRRADRGRCAACLALRRAARRSPIRCSVTLSTSSSGGPRQPGTSRASPRASCTRSSTRPERSVAEPRAQGSGRLRSRSPAPRAAATSSRGNGQTNTRVTQDCSLRSQAGEQIAVNPLDPNNILVGQNDARTGYNHCGYAWTLDGGAHWGDETPPFFQVPLLDKHAAEACSDPTVAWDSQGERLHREHDLQSRSSGERGRRREVEPRHPRRVLPLAGRRRVGSRSTARCRWASSATRTWASRTSRTWSADANAASPKRDWVYVTWTRIGPEQEDSPGGVREVFPIIFSQSEDGGVTWSAPDRDQRRGRRRLSDSSATSTMRRARSWGRTARSTSRLRTTTRSTAARRS